MIVYICGCLLRGIDASNQVRASHSLEPLNKIGEKKKLAISVFLVIWVEVGDVDCRGRIYQYNILFHFSAYNFVATIIFVFSGGPYILTKPI